MKIIKGTEKHIDQCLSIAKELRQYFTEKAITTMNTDFRTHSLYVAMDSNRVFGFTTVQRKSQNIAELSWLAVQPERHRQGIGSTLVDHIAHALTSQGVKLLEVKTLSADVDYLPYENTRRFYEKMGFLHLETIDPYPGWDPDSPCAIYVKIL